MVSKEQLEKYGFNFKRGSVHSSRTIMFEDLSSLFDSIKGLVSNKNEYLYAIKEQNCLKKKSEKARILAYKNLKDMYSLNSEMVVFFSLRYYWEHDIDTRPMLAFLCGYIRDPILSLTSRFVLGLPIGSLLEYQDVENFIEGKFPGRFSKASLRSMSRNLCSSWTKVGFLKGRVHKTRVKVKATAGSVCYALLLGYLTGLRGEALFYSEFLALLECHFHEALELAQIGSQKGWINIKALGNIIEVSFPQFNINE